MRNFVTGISICLLTIFSHSFTFAQEAKVQSFNSIDYMKVEAGMSKDYMALEKAWKKIHAHNIKNEKYGAWNVSQVLYPTGANENYNYIVRTFFKNEDQLASYLGKSPMPKEWKSLLTEEEIELVKRTSEIRTWVKSEVWTTIDYMSNSEETAKVTVFNFFSLPEGIRRSEHHKLEMDIWKPIHKAKMLDHKMEGWVLTTKRIPYGSNEKYVDATVDLYESMEQYIKSETRPYFEKVHPNLKIDDISKQTTDVSDLTRSEIRQWVMGVNFDDLK